MVAYGEMDEYFHALHRAGPCNEYIAVIAYLENKHQNMELYEKSPAIHRGQLHYPVSH